jgi:hypothetical protein
VLRQGGPSKPHFDEFDDAKQTVPLAHLPHQGQAGSVLGNRVGRRRTGSHQESDLGAGNQGRPDAEASCSAEAGLERVGALCLGHRFRKIGGHERAHALAWWSDAERAGASVLRPRDLGRHKRGVSDRDGRSLWASQSFNLGTELLHERRDNACTESGFWLRKVAVQPPNPIVRDRKFPIRSGHIERDCDLTFDCFIEERMLQCIDDEFGDDKAEALGLTGRNAAAFANHSQ